jgi:hypothetical protein
MFLEELDVKADGPHDVHVVLAPAVAVVGSLAVVIGRV